MLNWVQSNAYLMGIFNELRTRTTGETDSADMAKRSALEEATDMTAPGDPLGLTPFNDEAFHDGLEALIENVNSVAPCEVPFDTLLAKLQLISTFFTCNFINDQKEKRMILRFLNSNGRTSFKDISLYSADESYLVKNKIPGLKGDFFLHFAAETPDLSRFFAYEKMSQERFIPLRHVFEAAEAMWSDGSVTKHVAYVTGPVGTPVRDLTEMSYDDFFTMATDVATALQELHERGIQHAHITENSIRAYLSPEGKRRFRLVDVENFKYRAPCSPQSGRMHITQVQRNIIDYSRLMSRLSRNTASTSSGEKYMYMPISAGVLTRLSHSDYSLKLPEMGAGVVKNSRVFADFLYVSHHYTRHPPRSLNDLLGHHPFFTGASDRIPRRDVFGERFYRALNLDILESGRDPECKIS